MWILTDIKEFKESLKNNYDQKEIKFFIKRLSYFDDWLWRKVSDTENAITKKVLLEYRDYIKSKSKDIDLINKTLRVIEQYCQFLIDKTNSVLLKGEENVASNLEINKHFNVKLKKDGWHRKIQEWTFKNPPVFHNYCPYFWLTIFCLLVSPFVGFYKILETFFNYTRKKIKKTSEWIEKKIHTPFFEYLCKNMNDESIYISWQCSNYDWEVYRRNGGKLKYPKFFKLQRKLDTWKKLTPDWKTKLSKILENQEKKKELIKKSDKETEENKIEKNLVNTNFEEKALTLEEVELIKKTKEEKEKKKKEEVKARMEKFIKIINKTKKIVPFLLGAVGLYLCYFFYYGVRYIWNRHLYDYNWFFLMKEVLYIIAMIIAAIIAIFILYNLFTFISKVIEKRIEKIAERRVLENKVSFVETEEYYFAKEGYKGKIYLLINKFRNKTKRLGVWFKKIYNKFKDSTYFFMQYVKATKESYCPSIEWEEEKKEENK